MEKEKKDILKRSIVLVATCAAVSCMFSCPGSNYEIDGNRVKQNRSAYNQQIVEYKGKDKIKYVDKLVDYGLKKVIVNGERYKSTDTIVFPTAYKEYQDLVGKIDSIENVEHASKLQNRLENEKNKLERAYEDLEILKK